MGEPDLTAEELLAEYEGGRRSFFLLCLDGINLSGTSLDDVELDRTSLVGAKLRGAVLMRVLVAEADLAGADLREARLPQAFMYDVSLEGADLHGANLVEGSVFESNFTDTDMGGVSLSGAHIETTSFTGANLDRVSLGGTTFYDQDVGPFCDAGQLVHGAPSSIEARTVMRSYKHPRLKAFMVDCGVPELFAEYMIECAKALGDDLLRELMQTTFISYGGPDETFARRLYEALRDHGVVTFFFPETARVGERIGDEVFNALQRHERMILVCSRSSLDRPGVLNEIQETLDHEARDGGATYLIPVLLDDYLLTEWKETQPVLAERVGRRVAADFSDPARFDAALSRLLDALKKKRPGARPPGGLVL